MKYKKFISTVVYINSNSSKLLNFLNTLNSHLSELFDNYEILIVDDKSNQDFSKLKELSIPNLRLVELAWEHQLENAIFAGLESAIGDFVLEIENINIPINLEELKEVFRLAFIGNDIVSISYRVKGVNFLYNLFKKYISTRSSIGKEMLFCISRRALNTILNDERKLRDRKAIYNRTGFKKTEFVSKSKISIKFLSSLGNAGSILTYFDNLIAFTNLGFRTVLTIILSFLFFSIFYLAYVVANYFYNPHLIEGWATTNAILSIGFCGVFIILGILIRYASILLKEVTTKHGYKISSIELISNMLKKDKYK